MRAAATPSEAPRLTAATRSDAPRLTAADARRLVLAAQRLNRPRPAPATTRAAARRRITDAVRALGALQLDAINVVARTQLLVLYSRIGPFDPAALHSLTGAGGELFEYWAHAACLLPIADQPLLRWRMERYGEHPAWRHYAESSAVYLQAVFDEVTDRGPIPASQLSDPRRNVGEWWERRSHGRTALEYLFGCGRLAGWRSPSFEMVYDLPDRVIPAAVLGLPTPTTADSHRALALNASRALGVATAKDIAAYYVLKVGDVRPRVAELVEDGSLERVSVDGWRDPAYIVAGTTPGRMTRSGATLISPFDSLIWQRDRALRVFDLDYRIEVYVPERDRRFGYYVMPVLIGDRFVGRLDLKADRKASRLRVKAAHAEPGIDLIAAADATIAELRAMAQWLGLEAVDVADRGDWAKALGAAC